MSDPRVPRTRRWIAVAAGALALYAVVRATGTPQDDTAPSAGSSPSASPSGPSPSASPTPSPSFSYDPADQAAEVRDRARETGVSARLLMAILYNEAYKPHDPALEKAWQKYKKDAAFGIANMHRATYDEVRKGRDFASRPWEDLPDDRGLAIEAAAWYLHDLARQLPATWSAPYTEEELLALGYNTGAGNMLAFARGATPGDQARSYLEKHRANWEKAGEVVGTD
ncbi:lytic transglycosylase domain-containing protein [Streptomyces sp. CRN 30]|uniref:lytic transglycosylase domain-containing protein n=1 Tax=Streptomyces sp. CRN 30 TaxID=3075613 RepID=UPI002A8003C9|nr:lytic transglycosylase domain-containing protein [Streptomyces sp. CRN 30]